jgi:group II intron reverse transcriptase/maturase
MARAKQDPNARMVSLARLIDLDALNSAFDAIRKDAAVGVDGITKEQYAQNLEQNLQALHERLKAGRYRHQPIRRVHIPKAGGKTRPIGISSIEDKIVQRALTEVLEAIYEQDFVDCSYGFRPRRSAHDALRAVDAMVFREGMAWILEADIQAFFDSLDRNKLTEMLRIRVADESFMRLVGKCLHVGVLDGEEFSRPDEGTAQGSILSPMLGNVYLHYVLDTWFEREVKPTLTATARLVRFADDFVIGFQSKEDAERTMRMLVVRMAAFGLALHPDKTRLVPFGRSDRGNPNGKGPATFDFLGFTLYWRRARSGRWTLGMKTRKARLQRALVALGEFCRRRRHDPLKEQHAALVRRIQGHLNYFGVNGNLRALSCLVQQAERLWHKWLCRRSQRTRLTWQRFKDFLKVFPLPVPKIRVRIWATVP